MRGTAPGWIFCSLLPAALTACTFDPAGVHGLDAGAPASPDSGYDEFNDAAPGADATGPTTDATLADAEDTADATPPPADAHVCPQSYTVLPATGHAYRVRHVHQPWFQAKDSCERTGAGIHLAVLDDAAELAAVQTIIDVQTIWIGVNDVDAEGHFVAVTGGPATYLPWGAGEPNNSMGNEDCVELIGAALNDDACDTALPFLCECE